MRGLTPGLRRPALIELLRLVLAIVVAFALGALLVPRSAEQLRASVADMGPAAPVVFVVVGTALTCALFPYPILAATSGLLFGIPWGTAVSVVTGTTGAVAAFVIARVWGAAPLARIAGPRLRRLLAAVQRRGFVSVLYLRIVPGVPRDVANYAVGLTAVGLGPYAAATVIGIAPRAFAYTALGSSFGIGRLDSPEAVVAVALLAALAVVGVLILVWERRARRRPR